MVITEVKLPNGTILTSGKNTSDAIQNIKVLESTNRGHELTLGSTCSTMVELTILTSEGIHINTGDILEVSRVTDGSHKALMGTFISEKPVVLGTHTYRVVAYDNVSLLDKDVTQWLSQLNAWPYDLFNFAKLLCAECGLTFKNTSIPNGNYSVKKFSAKGVTGRDIMQWVGEISGQFCKADPKGLIELSWYTPVKLIIGTSTKPPEGISSTFYYMGTLTHADYSVKPIEKVQIQFSETDIGTIYPNVSGEKNTYKIVGNYLLTAESASSLVPVATVLYEKLSKVTYIPFKVTIPGSISIRAGSIVTIVDAKNYRFDSYVMQCSQNGRKTVLECTGSPYRSSSMVVNNRSFEALEGKYNNIKVDVDGIHTEVGDFKEQTKSNFEQTAQEISAKVSNMDGDEFFRYELMRDHFSLESQNKEVFRADDTGVKIKGKVEADSGFIGNSWHIEPWGIWSGDENGNKTVMQTAQEGKGYWMFAAGGTSLETLQDYKFRVNKDGYAIVEDGILGTDLLGWGIDQDNLHNYDYAGNNVWFYPDRLTANGLTISWEQLIKSANGSPSPYEILAVATKGTEITCKNGETVLTGTTVGEEWSTFGSTIFTLPNAGVWELSGGGKKSTVPVFEAKRIVVNLGDDVPMPPEPPEPPIDEHTLLLLHGDSIIDSSTHGVPLTNFGVQVSTAQSKFGGKSLYFDGENHTIQFPSQYCEFKDRDFTIDLWTYAKTANGCLFSTLLSPGSGFMFAQTGINIYGTSITNLWDCIHWNNAMTIPINTWVHWAFVRNGNQALLFKNGKLIGTHSMVGTIQVNPSLNSAIGTNAGESQPYKGFIDEFRISDVARWTSDFPVPEKPYDPPEPPKPPTDEHTLLLLHGENIIDSSKYNIPLTNFGVKVSTTQSKFGGKSLYFDKNARIEFPQKSIIYGTKDFTFDWWEYCTNVGCRFSSSAFNESDVNKKGMMLGSDGNGFRISTDGTAFEVDGANAFANFLNQWVHWACVRHDGKVITYKNGKKFKEIPVSDTYSVFQESQFNQAIGIQRSDFPSFSGYIDEFRISDVARWTSDFPVPEKPYDPPEPPPVITEFKVSLKPAIGVNYINGLDGLTPAEINAISMGISNNSDIKDANPVHTQIVYVDSKTVHRKITLGDTMQFTIKGVPYTFNIIGFNHDELTDSMAYGSETATGKAGITWQMKDLYETTYTIDSPHGQPGGWMIWSTCDMRQYWLPELYAQFQIDMLPIIKDVNKKTDTREHFDYDKNIELTSDNLFLVSFIEIRSSGETSSGSRSEGVPYGWYVAGNSKIKKRKGAVERWWLRSPFCIDQREWCLVTEDGDVTMHYAEDYNGTKHYYGLSFAFCT